MPSFLRTPKTLDLADQDSIAHFNVYLPLTHTDVLATTLAEQTESGSSNYHHWLTPKQFKEQFGPRRPMWPRWSRRWNSPASKS